MTGDTENGRSISVVRKALPLNSNLAVAQAAATPNTRFSGTAMAATSKVSQIADSVSGSASVSQTLAGPRLKACSNTMISGSSRNTAMKMKAAAIRNQRASGCSLVGEVTAALTAKGGMMATSAI